jgi:hypothetical protein
MVTTEKEELRVISAKTSIILTNLTSSSNISSNEEKARQVA